MSRPVVDVIFELWGFVLASRLLGNSTSMNQCTAKHRRLKQYAIKLFFPNAASKPSRHVESVKVFSMSFTSMCGDILCLSSTTTTECDLPTLSMNGPDTQTSHRIYRFIATEGKVCKWNNEQTANERTGCSITGSVRERLGQYDD